jgi:hypothetical protein
MRTEKAAGTIWLYWDGGPRPPYLEVCLRSVELFSECDVVIHDSTSISAVVPDIPAGFHHLKPAHQSDFYRLHVLYHHGGMYLDFDTFVVRSLRPLFHELETVELVGANWRARGMAAEETQALGSGVLGPTRPGLRFLEKATARQKDILIQNERRLTATGRPYSIRRHQLLAEIISQAYLDDPPVSSIKDGAATWFTLVGGPRWQGGVIGNPLLPLAAIGGRLPDSELFTISNNLLPEEVLRAAPEETAKGDTILAHLMRMVLDADPREKA